MRFTSKESFIKHIETEWRKLWDLLDKVSQPDLTTKALWGEGRTAKDVLMHVYEWQVMCMQWYRDGLKGAPAMPARGYKWNEGPKLNQAIYEKHEQVPLGEACRKLKACHARTVRLLNSLTPKQLLEPGYYAWCGKAKKLPLTSYFHANTGGHYRWAQRKVKQLLR